jgi:hypothetical protein
MNPFISGVRYPPLEHQLSPSHNVSPTYQFYKTDGVAGLDADFDYGAIVTNNAYGAAETTVQLANPGIYTNDSTQISTMTIGEGIQGALNSPKFTLSYTTDATNAQFALSSYNGTATSQTINYSYSAGTLKQEDRFGIRNLGDGRAIGFIYPDPLSNSGAIPIGTVTAGTASPLNYGQSYVLIHDTRSQMSMDLVDIKKTTSTSVDDWDYKLWNPINQHYRLQKGYLNLPNPVTAKYVKLEFSKLSATPYESIYNPNLPEVQFKAYPSWVVAYINDTFSQITALNQIQAETVSYDLINLGVQKPNQTLLSDPQPESLLAYIKSLTSADVTLTSQNQYNSWFNFAGASDIQTPHNLTPQVYPNTLFQEDSLYHTSQNPNALNQVYGAINTNAADTYSQEVPLNPAPVGPITARSDNSIVAEKNSPDLWFPRICRHGYQVVQTQRENKIAYDVAISKVGFYKKDRTVPNNDPFYFETLSDVSSADPSIPTTFVQSNWNFSVPFSSFALGPDQPVLGFEDFDGTPF